jgi:hypothetical protein
MNIQSAHKTVLVFIKNSEPERLRCSLKNKLVILLIFVSISNLYAGRGLIGRETRNEGILTVGVGAAHLFGDTGGSHRQPVIGIEDLVLEHVNLMYSAGFRFRHYPTTKLGYRLAFQHGNFSGSDEGSRLHYRQYAFEASVFQLSLQIEYLLLNRSNFWMYAFSGGGVAHSSVRLTGAPIRPMDSWKPAVTAPFASLGIGLETRFTRKSSLGLEIGTDYYFSNYIDGLNTYHSKHNDAIGYVMVTFSRNIFGGGVINKNRFSGCRWGGR